MESRASTLAELDAGWVINDDGRQYVFKSEVIDIYARPEKVWELVKNLSRYHEFSKGKLAITLQDELQSGTQIKITLFQDEVLGRFLPVTTATVNIVNDADKILGWQRPLPFGSGHSDHYHVLQPLPDGRGVRSYDAVYIPGRAGFFTDKTIRRKFENAFTELNQGIKREAEQESLASQFKI